MSSTKITHCNYSTGDRHSWPVRNIWVAVAQHQHWSSLECAPSVALRLSMEFIRKITRSNTHSIVYQWTIGQTLKLLLFIVLMKEKNRFHCLFFSHRRTSKKWIKSQMLTSSSTVNSWSCESNVLTRKFITILRQCFQRRNHLKWTHK